MAKGVVGVANVAEVPHAIDGRRVDEPAEDIRLATAPPFARSADTLRIPPLSFNAAQFLSARLFSSTLVTATFKAGKRSMTVS